MGESDEKARRWKDRTGKEWFVKRREASRGLAAGWVLRRVGYSIVAWDEEAEPSAERFQDYIDSHMARGRAGKQTARLWTDPRDRTEWEVFQDAGEIVFQRGVEAVRAPRGDGQMPPRSMDDGELQEALDRAQGGE